MNIARGDIFCTANPMWFGRAINFIQKINSIDNQSEYSHAGIILNEFGDTFESLWTIRKNHIDKYIGKKVIIGRIANRDRRNISKAILRVMTEHEGQWYPLWRLPLHIVPLLSKYVSSGDFPVCSETVAKYLYEYGMKTIGRWQGKNPDHVADMIKKWRAFDVVFEGEWLGMDKFLAMELE